MPSGNVRRTPFLDIWRQYAANIAAWEPLACGHYMQEEVPEQIYEHYVKFFKA